jgi:hypothetical protein
MTAPLLASHFVDDVKIVLSPIIPMAHRDADYHRQRAIERAALFAQLCRAPMRTTPVLVTVSAEDRQP